MKLQELYTERLVLRKLTPEVYRYVYETFTDAQLLSFFALPSLKELRIEKEKFAAGLSTYNKSFVYFQMLDRKSRTLIGACGFHTWYLDHDRAELGYAFAHPKYYGSGLMTEALCCVFEYGFSEMNLKRIEAFIGPGNEASLKLIRRLGFTEEGRLREHYCKNGTLEDSIVFSLLKNEYDDLNLPHGNNTH